MTCMRLPLASLLKLCWVKRHEANAPDEAINRVSKLEPNRYSMKRGRLIKLAAQSHTRVRLHSGNIFVPNCLFLCVETRKTRVI